MQTIHQHHSFNRYPQQQGYSYYDPINYGNQGYYPEQIYQNYEYPPSHYSPNLPPQHLYNNQYPEPNYSRSPMGYPPHQYHYNSNSHYPHQEFYPHSYQRNIYPPHQKRQNIQEHHKRKRHHSHPRSAPNIPVPQRDRQGIIKGRGQKAPLLKQVLYQQEPLNIPQSIRQVEYVPHLDKYMDYVQQQVKVPVEKYYTDYYEIQHITDFVPRQYEDTVVEMVPQEIVRYRLEYVPVEKKIVHLPKKQIYEDNGFYKGIGSLADRQINQAAMGVFKQSQQNQINKALYQNLSQSHASRENLNVKGLQESLVQGISREVQRSKQTQINRALYSNLQGSMRGNIMGQSQVNNVLHQNLGSRVGGGSPNSQQQINATLYQNFGNLLAPNSPNSQKQINQALYKNLSQSQLQQQNIGNLPANQLLNQQLYNSLLRQQQSQNRSRVSRRRTNYVTSEGYFPNYEEELRNVQSLRPSNDYYSNNYSVNMAERFQQPGLGGHNLAYNLGQTLMGQGASQSNMNQQSSGHNLAYNLGQTLMGMSRNPERQSKSPNEYQQANNAAYLLASGLGGGNAGSRASQYSESNY